MTVGSVGWRAVEGPVEGTNFALVVGTIEPSVGGPDFASVEGLLEERLEDQTLLRL